MEMAGNLQYSEIQVNSRTPGLRLPIQAETVAALRNDTSANSLLLCLQLHSLLAVESGRQQQGLLCWDMGGGGGKEQETPQRGQGGQEMMMSQEGICLSHMCVCEQSGQQ